MKLPLPQFIKECYLKRFGKPKPDKVVTIEERVKSIKAKKNISIITMCKFRNFKISLDKKGYLLYIYSRITMRGYPKGFVPR